MGVDYSYVNHDKKQFFTCGLYGWSSRSYAIGVGPGARALAILLSPRGTWRTDRNSIIGDDSNELDDMSLMAIDIEAELMLLDVDGPNCVQVDLAHAPYAFAKLCGFAFHLNRQDVISALDAKFRPGEWQRRYAEFQKTNTDYWSDQIVEAKNRQLKILV